MLETAVIVLAITACAFLIQEKLKIATPITVLGGALLYKAIGGSELLSINDADFDQLIFLLLPLLILTDSIQLKLEEIKANAASIFYAAVVSVALAVFAGVVISEWVLPYDDIPIPYLVMLFCMVIATDPVAVCSVFSSAKVPHKLKFTAETESLFNDCSAVVIFGIALMYAKADMAGEVITISQLLMHSSLAIGGAIVIGLVVGVVGVWLLSLSRNIVVETSLVLLIVYSAFLLAEHWHFAGILAILISSQVAYTIFNKRVAEDEQIIQNEREALEAQGAVGRIKHFFKLDNAIEDKASHESIKGFIQLSATLGTTVLFLSMAEMVHFEKILHYWKPILAVFVATTLIRAVMMMKFAIISNLNSFMQNINIRWWGILSFAGVKGGLSILLLHMVPVDFQYISMFSAIVIGNILLTTFIYPPVMMLIIGLNQDKFEAEALAEGSH